MSNTEAYDLFCIEGRHSLLEDPRLPSLIPPSNGSLEVTLPELRQQFVPFSQKINQLVKCLGSHPLMVHLAVGWIRTRVKMDDLSVVLDQFVQEFRAHGKPEGIVDSIMIDMLLQPLIGESKIVKDEDRPGLVGVLRFFTVVDQSGLPETLFRLGWMNIKRKKAERVEVFS